MDAVGRLKLHDAVFQREQREVSALADELTGKENRTLLTDEDASRRNQLTAVTLDAQPL